eukprot:7908081-Pyramimonas_sp.AAC.1
MNACQFFPLPTQGPLQTPVAIPPSSGNSLRCSQFVQRRIPGRRIVISVPRTFSKRIRRASVSQCFRTSLGYGHGWGGRCQLWFGV